MNNEDIKLLFSYLNSKEDLNDEMQKILNKLELVVKQIKLSDQYNKDMDELSKQFNELNN